jgi:tetratricopeptide (TPR) repeat protein
MDITECYRLLELTSTASQEEVKAAYRRLARQLHPDVNADHQAQEQFIRVTDAYKVLIKIAASKPIAAPFSTPIPHSTPTPTVATPKVKVSVQSPGTSQPAAQASPSEPPIQPPSPTATDNRAVQKEALSLAEQKLKLDTYRHLADLIKRRSLPRAIATVEALQARMPHDPEIRQWQALIYQRWGRQLIEENKLTQAKAYLKKALKTDPHNKSLWTEIEQDFQSIENAN